MKTQPLMIANRRNFIKIITGGIVGGISFLSFPQSSKARSLLTLRENSRLPSLPDNIHDFSPSDERFWRIVRDQFPLDKNRIYMNNGTMGPSPYFVQDTMKSKEEEVNETGEYGGHDEARPKIAKFINCNDDEVSLTHNVTEGINIIAQGIKIKSGDEVIITNHEHVGNALPWLTRAKRDGVVIKVAELGKDANDVLNKINDKITKKTRVIAVPHMTCTQGQVLPGKEISKLGHDKGLWVMLDGAHPPGMFPVDVKDLGCDYYASCGHKWMLAPKGTGFLYLKKDMFDTVEPIMTGGGSDNGFDYEHGIKGWANTAHRYDYGSQSAALFIGLGASVDFLTSLDMKNIAERGRALATHLMKELKEIPNVEILTPEEEKSRASITGFKLKNMDFGKFQNWLNEKYKIRIRGVGESNLNSLRISTHIYNSFDEVNLLLKAIKEASDM